MSGRVQQTKGNYSTSLPNPHTPPLCSPKKRLRDGHCFQMTTVPLYLDDQSWTMTPISSSFTASTRFCFTTVPSPL